MWSVRSLAKALNSDTHLVHSMSLRQRARITVGLIAASGLVGGVCAVLGLTPILILRIIHSTSDDAFVPLADITPFVFGLGATLGALLGPLVAWTALRHVPVWRLFLEPAAGTVVGAFVGWAVPWIMPLGLPRLLLFPLVGMTVGVIRLRRAVPSYASDHSPPALSNER